VDNKVNEFAGAGAFCLSCVVALNLLSCCFACFLSSIPVRAILNWNRKWREEYLAKKMAGRHIWREIEDST
jgi:hypothetical protein